MKLKTLSLLLLLATPVAAQRSGGASQDLAQQLPASTLFYFEIPDVPGLRDGLAESSMGRIYHDPGVQQFASGMVEMGMGQWQMVLGQAAEGGMPVEFLSWDAFRSLAFGFAMGEGQQGPDPGVTVAASIGFGPGLGTTAFEMIASMASVDGGATINIERGESQSLLSGTDDDGATTFSLRRVQDHLTLVVRHNMAGNFPTLAANRAYTTARAQLMTQGMATFGYYNPQATLAMQRSFLRLGEMDEGLSSLTNTVLTFSEEAVGNAQAISFASGWKNGESIDTSFIGFGGEEPGWAFRAPPADQSLVEYIPADATSFTITGVGNSEGTERMLAGLDRVLADQDMQQNLAVWQEYEPVSHSWIAGENRPLLDKALSAFGSRSFSYSTPTGARMFVELTDPEALQAAVTPLMKTLAQALDDFELPVSIRAKRENPRDRPDLKVPVYYLRLKAEVLPPEIQQFAAFLTSFEPSFAIHPDGWMIGSFSRSQVRSVIRGGVVKAEHSIQENEEAADFLGRVPTGASRLGWSDPRPGVAQMVGFAQLGLGLLSGVAPLPFDPADLPGPSSFTQHMRTSESVMWMAEDGIHSWSRGSFGLADLMAMAGYCLPAGAMWFTTMKTGAMAPGFDVEHMPPVEDTHYDDPVPQTFNDLARLQTGVLLYELANSKLPAELHAILGKSDDGTYYIENPGHGIGTDAWGNAFVYKLTGEGFALYSVGENGVDENGEGDDISIE